MLLSAVVVLTARASSALARSEKAMGYAPKDVWSPTVRFLRVDENLTLVERDPETGYILFELREEKKVFRGSVEIIAAPEHGVRVILDLRERPSYVELAMLERLERKLASELGPAPSPPSKPAKPDKPERSPDDERPADKDKDQAAPRPGDKRGPHKRPADRRRDDLPEAPTVPIPEA
jgi:hypothetical protein